MRKIYQVLSPDGFATNCNGAIYKSKKKATEALQQFADNYKTQGYYSTVQQGERVRIPYNQIINYCEIKEI
jgi:hypothetical protein